MAQPRGAMTVEKRLLANVDRRLLAHTDHAEGVQLVKVPVSDAVWSTWRRYCSVVGVSMGRGLAFLLEHELASVVHEDLGHLADKIAARKADHAAEEARLAGVERQLLEREAKLSAREGDLAVARGKLARREAAIAMREAKAAQRPAPPRTRKPPKIGRNDPCWCGSGKKFKVCHLGASP